MSARGGKVGGIRVCEEDHLGDRGSKSDQKLSLIYTKLPFMQLTNSEAHIHPVTKMEPP